MQLVQVIEGLVKGTAFVIYMVDTSVNVVDYEVRLVMGQDYDQNVLIKASASFYPVLGKMYIKKVDVVGVMTLQHSNAESPLQIVRYFFHGIYTSLIAEVQELFLQFEDAVIFGSTTIGSVLKSMPPDFFPGLNVIIHERITLGRWLRMRNVIQPTDMLDGTSTFTEIAGDEPKLNIMAVRNPDLSRILTLPWVNTHQTDHITAYVTSKHFCQVYPSCDAYIVIAYMPQPNGGRLYLGHLVAMLFDTFMEVYDVYVSPAFRNMKVGKHLMHFVTSNNIKDFVWLGILLDNPFFQSASQLYLKAGFYHPVLTTKTLGGAPIGQAIIAMVYVAGAHTTLGHREKSKAVERIACHKLYKLGAKMLRMLYNFLDVAHEVGGSIGPLKSGATNVDDIAEDLDIDKYMNEITLLKSGDPTTHVVPLHDVDLEYSFHTHPAVCYRDYNSLLGWPSSMDIGLVVTNYNTLKVHIVVSIEGIYVMNQFTEFNKFMKAFGAAGRNDIVEAIYALVIDTFRIFDNKRFNNIDAKIKQLSQKTPRLNFHEKQELMLYLNIKSMMESQKTVKHFMDARIDHFLTYVNNVTLDNMLEQHDEVYNAKSNRFASNTQISLLEGQVPEEARNIPMLDIQFFDWQQMNLIPKTPCKNRDKPLTHALLTAYGLANNASHNISTAASAAYASIDPAPLYFTVNNCIKMKKM